MPRYTLLMASLPPLGTLFGSPRPTISRLRLESRLTLLNGPDTRTFHLLADILFWALQPLGRSDPQLLAACGRFFAEVRNPTLRRLVEERLTLRTIVAALRRRHRGESEPPPRRDWGFGPWVDAIERRWQEPTFGLEGVFPWLPEAHRLLEEGDLVGLERLQFSLSWKALDRLEAGHCFDLEAVMLYVSRWSLVERWSHYDGEAALTRFRELVDAALVQVAALQPAVLQPAVLQPA